MKLIRVETETLLETHCGHKHIKHRTVYSPLFLYSCMHNTYANNMAIIKLKCFFWEKDDNYALKIKKIRDCSTCSHTFCALKLPKSWSLHLPLILEWINAHCWSVLGLIKYLHKIALINRAYVWRHKHVRSNFILQWCASNWTRLKTRSASSFKKTS